MAKLKELKAPSSNKLWLYNQRLIVWLLCDQCDAASDTTPPLITGQVPHPSSAPPPMILRFPPKCPAATTSRSHIITRSSNALHGLLRIMHVLHILLSYPVDYNIPHIQLSTPILTYSLWHVLYVAIHIDFIQGALTLLLHERVQTWTLLAHTGTLSAHCTYTEPEELLHWNTHTFY